MGWRDGCHPASIPLLHPTGPPTTYRPVPCSKTRCDQNENPVTPVKMISITRRA